MQRSRKRKKKNLSYWLRRMSRRISRRRTMHMKRATASPSRHTKPTRHAVHHKYHVNWKRMLPSLCFLLTGIISLSLLLNYGIESLRRRKDNEQLSIVYSGSFADESDASGFAEATLDPDANLATPEPKLKSTYRTLSGEPFSQAKSLYQQNNDLVGWLHIKGVVDLPVVYRDNEFYLTHNFKQKSDKGGALFLDENHPLTEATQNLVIHGHNMHDSSMFGILSSYHKLNVVKANPFAAFSTMYNQEQYVIFAVLRVNTAVKNSQYFNYIGKPRFKDELAFYNYTGEIKDRSLFSIPIDVQPSDSLLTLATCIQDDRLVVFYRSVRSGETKEQLQALVRQAAEQ